MADLPLDDRSISPPLDRHLSGADDEEDDGLVKVHVDGNDTANVPSLEIPRDDAPTTNDTTNTSISRDSSISATTPSDPPPSPLLPDDSDATIASQRPASSSDQQHTPPFSSSNRTSASSSLSLPPLPLNVKFAPLPELAPRRRRSNVPLGMAARGQLMRRNRGFFNDNNKQGQPNSILANPAWMSQEFEVQRLKHEALAAQYAQYTAAAAAIAARQDEEALLEEEEQQQLKHNVHAAGRKKIVDDLEDFASLGRIVKFWKKVSLKDVDVDGLGTKPKDQQEKEKEGENSKFNKEEIAVRRGNGLTSMTISSSPNLPLPQNATSAPPPPPPPLRPILATITRNVEAPLPPPPPLPEEGGGVWEEEIGDGFPINVGQTETVVEGRAVYSAKAATTTTATVISKVEAVSSPQSPTKVAKMPSILSKSTKRNSLLGALKS